MPGQIAVDGRAWRTPVDLRIGSQVRLAPDHGGQPGLLPALASLRRPAVLGEACEWGFGSGIWLGRNPAQSLGGWPRNTVARQGRSAIETATSFAGAWESTTAGPVEAGSWLMLSTPVFRQP